MTEPHELKNETIEYGTEGKIPWGIWVIWGVFGAWAVWYTAAYSVPDLMAWLREIRR